MSNKCPWCQSEKAHLHLKLNDYFLTQEPFEIMVCEDCGLLYTTPKLSEDRLSDYYKSDEYYSHQENKKGFIPRVYEAVKSVNLKHKIAIATHGKQLGRLLDIGCGVGDFLHFAEHNGWQCTGAEPSEKAAAIAKNRIQGKIIKPLDLEKLPDESFDVITMWHVLEHVSNLQWQVNQLNRLLKKGGRLVIALPNYKSYDAQFYQDEWAAYDVPRHLNHFSQDSIAKIFNINGLVQKPTQKLIWDSYYISFLSEKYRRKRLPLIRGCFRGLISNLKARKNGEWSSLVYVYEKL